MADYNNCHNFYCDSVGLAIMQYGNNKNQRQQKIVLDADSVFDNYSRRNSFGLWDVG